MFLEISSKEVVVWRLLVSRVWRGRWVVFWFLVFFGYDFYFWFYLFVCRYYGNVGDVVMLFSCGRVVYVFDWGVVRRYG